MSCHDASRLVIRVLIFFLIAVGRSALTYGAAPEGNLSAHIDGVTVSVLVESNKLDRCYYAQAAFVWGAENECPDQYIREMGITVNGRLFFVPLSVFADLANPTKLSIRRGKVSTHFEITLQGGDAGTSYIAIISLREQAVLGRKVVSKEFPKEAYETTTYRWNRTTK